jgi:hypothetical protein
MGLLDLDVGPLRRKVRRNRQRRLQQIANRHTRAVISDTRDPG